MQNKRLLSVLALLGLGLPSMSFVSVATAQSVSNLLDSNDYSANIGFVPPVNDGAPSRTRSGATRDLQCGGTALVPDSGLGLTTEAMPALHMYVEPSVEKLVLTLEGGEDDYTKDVQLSGEGGIVEVTLPESMPALEVGDQYSWSLIMICGQSLRPDSPVVFGDIRRVEPIFTPSQTASVSMADKATAYGEAGLWHDLIATMTVMRQDNPEDGQLQARWESILSTVGLAALADENLI